ncbi:unnamed protein product, partial [Mesorhabditis spiculigera]
MASELPIDIHCAKLLDWLISRRHSNREWQKNVLAIREKIKTAILDMPESEEVVRLLSGTSINYFHCQQIINILKETEKDTKNFLGFYSSQRMKDWQEIESLYKKDNVYLAEAAQILQRFVQYEIPGLKRQIAKADQSLEEGVKKEKDYLKQSADAKKDYHKELERLGLQGKKLRSELLALAADLPAFFAQQNSQIGNLAAARDYYANFRTYLLRGVLPTSAFLPALSLLFTKGGNATAYELKHGKAPDSVELPNYDLLLRAGEEEKPDEGIDFGDDIDFGDGDAIDFGESIQIETVGDDTGATLGGLVARGDEALPLLENTSTQKTVKNELKELLGFLAMRLEDEERESPADNLVLAAEVRPENAKVPITTLNTWIRLIKEILADLSAEHRIHLFKIRSSPQYVETLVEALERKHESEARYAMMAEAMKERQSGASETAKKLRAELQVLLSNTKELQEQIAAEISKKYENRRVNIMGGYTPALANIS